MEIEYNEILLNVNIGGSKPEPSVGYQGEMYLGSVTIPALRNIEILELLDDDQQEDIIDLAKDEFWENGLGVVNIKIKQEALGENSI